METIPFKFGQAVAQTLALNPVSIDRPKRLPPEGTWKQSFESIHSKSKEFELYMARNNQNVEATWSYKILPYPSQLNDPQFTFEELTNDPNWECFNVRKLTFIDGSDDDFKQIKVHQFDDFCHVMFAFLNMAWVTFPELQSNDDETWNQQDGNSNKNYFLEALEHLPVAQITEMKISCEKSEYANFLKKTLESPRFWQLDLDNCWPPTMKGPLEHFLLRGKEPLEVDLSKCFNIRFNVDFVNQLIKSYPEADQPFSVFLNMSEVSISDDAFENEGFKKAFEIRDFRGRSKRVFTMKDPYPDFPLEMEVNNKKWKEQNVVQLKLTNTHNKTLWVSSTWMDMDFDFPTSTVRSTSLIAGALRFT
ncbi:hypothetical protein L596_005743 [Steinernema carpocapsae]|uniref:Uncharacterized protein n=1 Tax=Steinernema carpocapsae TaxID=34508 RepID=A0A4U8V185_STECR|nr:hypothetical protein L596_005743 [Steinernema carpocapsae]